MEARASAPMSPPPPAHPSLSSITPHHGRWPEGWAPGENDTSLMAADWRGSNGLRVARRVEDKHDALAPEVAALTAAVAALTRVAKWTGLAFATVWAASVAHAIYTFVSTLHH